MKRWLPDFTSTGHQANVQKKAWDLWPSGVNIMSLSFYMEAPLTPSRGRRSTPATTSGYPYDAQVPQAVRVAQEYLSLDYRLFQEPLPSVTVYVALGTNIR